MSAHAHTHTHTHTHTRMGTTTSMTVDDTAIESNVTVHPVSPAGDTCDPYGRFVHLSNSTRGHMCVIGGGTALAHDDTDVTTIIEVENHGDEYDHGVVMSKWPADELFVVVPGIGIVPLTPMPPFEETFEYAFGRFDIGERFDRVFVGPSSTNMSPSELNKYCPEASASTGVITRGGRCYVCVWFITWHRDGRARCTAMHVPIANNASIPVFPQSCGYLTATEHTFVCAFQRRGDSTSGKWCVGKYNLHTGKSDGMHMLMYEPQLCVEDSGAVVDVRKDADGTTRREIHVNSTHLLPHIGRCMRDRAGDRAGDRADGVSVRDLIDHVLANADTPAGVDKVELIRIRRDNHDGFMQTLVLDYVVPTVAGRDYGVYEWRWRNESTNRA